MTDIYYLPPHTESIVNKKIGQCKNLALILDKYPECIVIEDTSKKGEWLQRLVKESHIDVELAEASYQRWVAMTGKLHATRFRSKLSWRMVIGLGGGNALETDLTLHHHYGVPFIPGSALKGLTRAYVAGEEEQFFIEKKGRKVPSSSEEEDHEEVKRVFGSQNSAGTVTFYDAVPYDGQCRFAVDIMNPHYPDYYKTLKSTGRVTPPSNDQSPIPVVFLTVDTMDFAFAVAPRDPQNTEHQQDAEKVAVWLHKALANYGVGGKTSAGYGLFLKDQPGSIEDTPVAQQAQDNTPDVASQPASHRLSLPTFREGDDILGVVIEPTVDMKAAYPGATQYLRYKEYPRDQLLLAIEAGAQEAQNWKVHENRFGIYVRTEQHNGVMIIVCKPRPPKEKKAKKNK